MTEWGKPIEVNGKRPAWLGDAEKIFYQRPKDDFWFGRVFDYAARELGDLRDIERIRLPSDHWAYKALDLGFEPWGGGDRAPDDWDGGDVLRRGAAGAFRPDFVEP